MDKTMRFRMIPAVLVLALVIFLGLGVVNQAQAGRELTGAAIGAVAGAVVGQIAAEAPVQGAIVGAIVGVAVAHATNNNDQEMPPAPPAQGPGYRGEGTPVYTGDGYHQDRPYAEVRPAVGWERYPKEEWPPGAVTPREAWPPEY